MRCQPLQCFMYSRTRFFFDDDSRFTVFNDFRYAPDVCTDEGCFGVHRIEAACLPNNAASQAVLRRAGFSHEGLARKYLRINGQWADHLVFALLREDFYPRGEQP